MWILPIDGVALIWVSACAESPIEYIFPSWELGIYSDSVLPDSGWDLISPTMEFDIPFWEKYAQLVISFRVVYITL